jgi:hypothetical protein
MMIKAQSPPKSNPKPDAEKKFRTERSTESYFWDSFVLDVGFYCHINEPSGQQKAGSFCELFLCTSMLLLQHPLHVYSDRKSILFLANGVLNLQIA